MTPTCRGHHAKHLHLNTGVAGVEINAEEAIKVLSKALRKIWDVGSLSQIRVDALGPAPTAAAPENGGILPHWALLADCVIPLACVPAGREHVLMPMVARAALFLAYLHFDGEGTKADPGEACRLFKLATACGSKEAEGVLGW